MATEFEVDADFLFIGRTFAEYVRMFGLDPTALTGRTVLDCPGGPGSFTAVAAEFADRVLAADPVYGRSLDALAVACEDAIERNVTQLREKRDLFVWDEYGDVTTRERYLRAAAERFLADLARHPNRYIAAALPSLPLGTNAIDLALCGNLLFLYDDRLDEAFHRDALLELARVASAEVRVFPLHSLDRQRSPLVGPVSEALRARGLTVAVESVPYEFQPGATEVLVVSETASYRGAP